MSCKHGESRPHCYDCDLDGEPLQRKNDKSFIWYGKSSNDMTREELIECCISLHRTNQFQSHEHQKDLSFLCSLGGKR